MNATHALGELTPVAQDKNGWFTRDLQRRYGNLRLDMKHSDYSRLKYQELISMKGTVIHAPAELLQVSVRRVARASNGSMGLEVPATQADLEDAAHDSQKFSARDRQIIQGLVNTSRAPDATNQEGAADKPTHVLQAGNTLANLKGKKAPFADPHAHPEADESGRVALPANYYELAATCS